MILIAMITLLIFNARSRMILVSLVSALLLVSCTGTADSETAKPLVVATTSIWGDVVEQIVGDDADVEVLIPRGADAHDYEPAPRQVALLHEADLVVANGLGLEQGLMAVLDTAASDGANILEVAPLLDPIPFAHHDHEDEHGPDEDHDHDHDPHVWLDLVRMAKAVDHIAEHLDKVDDSVDWAGRAESYSQQLIEADGEAARILDVVEAGGRRLVTNHEALGYFADRYDFELIGVVIPGGSTLAEPSASELAALVEEMRHEGVDTIFAETTSSTRLAEAVAEEAGEEVAVVELHTESLGEPGSEADNLIGLLLSNARLVAEALTR